MRLLKSMYGTLTAPLLWYNLFASKLIKERFTLNPYDLCVANKMVNGSQMTICWYVDDLKASHVDPHEAEKMMSIIEDQFGKMNIVYGNDQTYLGMKIKIRNKQVQICMQSYLEESIVAFGDPINSAAKSTSTRYLIQVDESEPLSEEQTITFHHIVAKLLHVTKRARLDIQPTVFFYALALKFQI